MKRGLLTLVMVCFLFTMSASSQDLTGEMLVGGFLGYSLGMGDLFSDIETTNYKYTFGPGFNFGGTFYYGLNEKMMIGGELMFQSYKADIEYKIAGSYYGGSGSTTELNILGSVLYALSNDDETALFLMGGIGFYNFGGMKLGLNAGVMYRKMITPQLGIYGAPRFHLVLGAGTFELLQLMVGVQYSLGS